MGFLEDVGIAVVGGYPVKNCLQKRHDARHRITSGGFKQDVESLINGLDSLDSVLQGAEHGAYMTDYAEKIASFREKLDTIKDFISKPYEAYEALEDVWDFTNAVKATAKFSPGQDPLNEAKAYGAALTSFGKIAGRIPLLKPYASFFEEMGKAFAQTVANIVPHLRGTYQRENDKYTQGGDPYVFTAP